MTLGMFLLIFGLSLPFVATCLILLGYLLGRIRPIARWRLKREIHPVHNVEMGSLGLPTNPQFGRLPSAEMEEHLAEVRRIQRRDLA